MRSPIPRYTFLAFELNHLLDAGKQLDPDETITRLESGTFFTWLDEQYGQLLDLSLYDDAELETIMSAMANIVLAVNMRKKFGVEVNGIAMALACCIQILQAGAETYEHD